MKNQINKTNFFNDTRGRFIQVETPSTEPDYVSFNSNCREAGISSRYHFMNGGVVRTSNHWGGVASCQWNLEGVNEFGLDDCRKTKVRSGFITF